MIENKRIRKYKNTFSNCPKNQKLPEILSRNQCILTSRGGQCPPGPPLPTPMDGYQFIHRNSHTSAGGVGIYVKSSISYNLKPTINIDLSSVENLWIEIEINKKKLIVGVVYRHPV